MATPNELADIILATDESTNAEWKKVPLNVCSVRLGNFVQKRQRNFFIRLVPLFEKYSYHPDNENLKDFLKERRGQTFSLQDISVKKTLPKNIVTTDRDLRPTIAAGEEVQLLSMGGNYTSGTRTEVPARNLNYSYIKRDSLEKQLKIWSLNMESDYIKDMKRENVIPCIVNELCEAIQPTDETDGLATSTKRRKVEGSIKYYPTYMPITPTIRLGHETSEEKHACVIGPVLYKTLPLEVSGDGKMTATKSSKGFLKDTLPVLNNARRCRIALCDAEPNKPSVLGPQMADIPQGGMSSIVSDGAAGQFSSTSNNSNPTLQSSYRAIEKLLGHIVRNEDIANAFRCLNSDEIQYLCRMFEKQEHTYEDLDIPDDNSVSTNCRNILLFAGFESQKPGTLTLKKTVMVAPPETLKASYYLSVLLFETPGDMLKYLKASTVNLFPLLRDVLLLKYPGGDVEVRGSDAVLSCPDAMNLLKSLDIGIKGSSVVSFPKSRECLATVVWVAMLYGGQCNAVQ
ncbi:uncharacterized protein [Argopecten irradians]|uniref:uncharacterized protein isoform X2 n=1 Tax=Argopecten irradians TaxID=31199 RepID=UPI003716C2BA